MDACTLRNLRESDHATIVSVVDEWWGRPVSGKLPRLFFRHFGETSFVVEEGGGAVAFLVGFVSQSRPEGYIHFAGVHPDFRGRGIASKLYERFFEVSRLRGCERVRCITSPVNTDSIAFHKRMGFELLPGDDLIDGVPVHSNYDGDGGPKVIFVRGI